MKVSFSPQASDDLLELAEFIARDSLEAALRVVDELEAEVRRLRDNPGLGHTRLDLVHDSSLRFWHVFSYLIIYRTSPGVIEIARILSGHRDLPHLLE